MFVRCRAMLVLMGMMVVLEHVAKIHICLPQTFRAVRGDICKKLHYSFSYGLGLFAFCFSR